MKKSDFLELLKDIPDDANIAYIYQSEESSSYYADQYFSIEKLYESRNGEPTYFLNYSYEKPMGFIDEFEYSIKGEIQKFVDTFPKDKYPNWTFAITNRCSSSFRIIATFSNIKNYDISWDKGIATFNKLKKHSGVCERITFTDWEVFVESVIPEIEEELDRRKKDLARLIELNTLKAK